MSKNKKDVEIESDEKNQVEVKIQKKEPESFSTKFEPSSLGSLSLKSFAKYILVFNFFIKGNISLIFPGFGLQLQ